MHPIIDVFFAGGGFALGDFVGVVNGDVVNPAAVDIQRVAQVFHSHSGTFNMPPRETDPPRAVPLHLALFIRRGELPQRKIRRVAFFVAHFHPRAALQAANAGMADKRVIAGKFGSIVINTVTGAVSIAFFFQFFYQRNHLFYMLGGTANNRRPRAV